MQPASPGKPAEARLAGEWAQLGTAPTLANMDLLHARYTRHRFAPHIHEEYAIGVIERGVEQLGMGAGGPVIVDAGTIVAINPGDLHSGAPATSDGWTYRMFYPAAGLLLDAAADLHDRPVELPHFPIPAIRDPLPFRTMQQTHRSLMDPAVPLLEQQVRFAGMLAALVARHARQARPAATRTRHNVTRAVEYLDAHYREPVTLNTLSALAGLSRFHFCRAFKRQTGVPPHTYQTLRRIEHSKQLIRAGRPLAEVALDTGFFDQSHLGRHFKRVVGVTPGVYAT